MGKRSVRILAAFVACAHFWTQCVFLHAQERDFWADRRTATRRVSTGETGAPPSGVSSGLSGEQYQVLAGLPHAGQVAFGATQSASVGSGLSLPPASGAPASLDLPPSSADSPAWISTLILPYGSIREIHLAKRPAAPLVIHIQDAHGIEEAQKNIAAMIQGLGENRGVNLVGLEGASGAFNLAPYRNWPDAAVTRDVAAFFLKEGKIGGPEFAGLTAPHSPVLWGVEDADLYLSNVKALRDSLKEKSAMRGTLAGLKAAVDPLKESLYSKELKEFDRHTQAYQGQQEGLAAYVRYLMGARTADKGRLPNLALLLRALSAEEALNFKKVERERLELVEMLAKRLPPDRLNLLVQRSFQYRAGRMGYGDYHRFLLDLCRDNQIPLGGLSQLTDYIAYVLLAEKIDRNALLEELKRLESAVQDLLAVSSEQKRLVAVGRRLGLLEKLAAQAMTPQDWAAYQDQREDVLRLVPDIHALGGRASVVVTPEFLTPFENFCRSAVGRNEAFIANLAGRMEKQKASAAVLVAGGFHSDGLTRLLRDKDFSYVVVTPKITEVPKDSNYLDVFARDPLPLEKLFAGDKIFLKDPEGIADQPIDVGINKGIKPDLITAEGALEGLSGGISPSAIEQAIEKNAAEAGSPLDVDVAAEDGLVRLAVDVDRDGEEDILRAAVNPGREASGMGSIADRESIGGAVLLTGPAPRTLLRRARFLVPVFNLLATGIFIYFFRDYIGSQAMASVHIPFSGIAVAAALLILKDRIDDRWVPGLYQKLSGKPFEEVTRNDSSNAMAGQAVSGSVPSFVFFLFLAGILVPIVEELIFRAPVPVLARFFGVAPVLVVAGSAAIFSFLHLGRGWASGTIRFSAGLIYGLAYLATGNVMIPVAMHVFENCRTILRLRKAAVTDAAKTANLAIKTGVILNEEVKGKIKGKILAGQAYKVWARSAAAPRPGDAPVRTVEGLEAAAHQESIENARRFLDAESEAWLDRADIVVVRGEGLLYFRDAENHQALRAGPGRRAVYVGEGLWNALSAHPPALAAMLRHELFHVAHPDGTESDAVARENAGDPAGARELRRIIDSLVDTSGIAAIVREATDDGRRLSLAIVESVLKRPEALEKDKEEAAAMAAAAGRGLVEFLDADLGMGKPPVYRFRDTPELRSIREAFRRMPSLSQRRVDLLFAEALSALYHPDEALEKVQLLNEFSGPEGRAVWLLEMATHVVVDPLYGQGRETYDGKTDFFDVDLIERILPKILQDYSALRESGEERTFYEYIFALLLRGDPYDSSSEEQDALYRPRVTDIFKRGLPAKDLLSLLERIRHRNWSAEGLPHPATELPDKEFYKDMEEDRYPDERSPMRTLVRGIRNDPEDFHGQGSLSQWESLLDADIADARRSLQNADLAPLPLAPVLRFNTARDYLRSLAVSYREALRRMTGEGPSPLTRAEVLRNALVAFESSGFLSVKVLTAPLEMMRALLGLFRAVGAGLPALRLLREGETAPSGVLLANGPMLAKMSPAQIADVLVKSGVRSDVAPFFVALYVGTRKTLPAEASPEDILFLAVEAIGEEGFMDLLWGISRGFRAVRWLKFQAEEKLAVPRTVGVLAERASKMASEKVLGESDAFEVMSFIRPLKPIWYLEELYTGTDWHAERARFHLQAGLQWKESLPAWWDLVAGGGTGLAGPVFEAAAREIPAGADLPRAVDFKLIAAVVGDSRSIGLGGLTRAEIEAHVEAQHPFTDEEKNRYRYSGLLGAPIDGADRDRMLRYLTGLRDAGRGESAQGDMAAHLRGAAELLMAPVSVGNVGDFIAGLALLHATGGALRRADGQSLRAAQEADARLLVQIMAFLGVTDRGEMQALLRRHADPAYQKALKIQRLEAEGAAYARELGPDALPVVSLVGLSPEELLEAAVYAQGVAGALGESGDRRRLLVPGVGSDWELLTRLNPALSRFHDKIIPVSGMQAGELVSDEELKVKVLAEFARRQGLFPTAHPALDVVAKAGHVDDKDAGVSVSLRDFVSIVAKVQAQVERLRFFLLQA